MNWYLKVLKQYADFNGRARRKEYWMFTLFSIIISYGIQLTALLTGLEFLSYIYIAYSLAVFIPSIAVVVRRLHDVEKSGWFWFIILIPLVGIIWLLILLCTDGTKGPNKYGVDPKNPTDELEEIGTAQA